MNRERLIKLQELLDNHDKELPEIRFAMHEWSCKTAACALGSAAIHPWFRRRGLTTSEYGTPRCKGSIGSGAGAEFFDISIDKSELLFFPENYSNKKGKQLRSVTRKHVIAKIQLLLDGKL